MVDLTVRDLAIALEDQQSHHKSSEYNPVVTLQAQGNKTPLWLVHPGVGEVLVFLNLAKFLVDRKVYALRPRCFNEGEKPFETTEEVVRTYHAAIKRKQPQGPYALAGYSYGTMLAFEVGKVLESQGDEVRFLGSFNLPLHIKARMRQLDYKGCLLHLSYFLDLMTEDRTRELALELQGATRETAMAASSKAQWLSEHLSQWKDFSRSSPNFHDVRGAHCTILGPGYVFGFQQTLRSALDARGIWDLSDASVSHCSLAG